MKSLKYVGLFLAFMLLAACSAITTTSSTVIKENTWYPVGKVLNNKSFEIILGDHIEQVTFLSLDIIDINNEQLGTRVHEYISEQLQQSEEVMLSFDTDMRTESGQLVAIVQLKDGTSLNDLLLEKGYAKVLIVEPNIKMENIYKQIEQIAKSNKVGLWSNEDETSNDDVSIKQTPYTGISLSVNKQEQKAVISNYTANDVDLSHWKLVSVTGNQTYVFDEIILEPREKITIYSIKNPLSLDNNSFYWGSENIWDVTQKDSAELYNTKNELIAEWDE